MLNIYTDGVVEAMDSDHTLYGAQRLVEVVDRLYDSSPREVVRGIRESIEAFAGNAPLSDDTTYIVCRIM
jgi:sigma-B regulation protein RsbU (phosphoserine phosphatase)